MRAFSWAHALRPLARARSDSVDYAFQACLVWRCSGERSNPLLVPCSSAGGDWLRSLWRSVGRRISRPATMQPLARAKSFRVDSRIRPTVVQRRELGVANLRVNTIVSACISPRLLARARMRRVDYALYSCLSGIQYVGSYLRMRDRTVWTHALELLLFQRREGILMGTCVGPLARARSDSVEYAF